jgi:hypothetical protein
MCASFVSTCFQYVEIFLCRWHRIYKIIIREESYIIEKAKRMCKLISEPTTVISNYMNEWWVNHSSEVRMFSFCTCSSQSMQMHSIERAQVWVTPVDRHWWHLECEKWELSTDTSRNWYPTQLQSIQCCAMWLFVRWHQTSVLSISV